MCANMYRGPEEELDDERVYTVAITKFMYGGGDNITGYTHGELRYDGVDAKPPVTLPQYIERYMRKLGENENWKRRNEGCVGNGEMKG